MSTEIPTVTLIGTAMVPLVRAAAALAFEDIPPFAVIGGVAVTVCLGRALRATVDLDAVTDQRYTPTALQILRGSEDAAYGAADPHTITISGAEVQFQDVEPVSDADVSQLRGEEHGILRSPLSEEHPSILTEHVPKTQSRRRSERRQGT